MLSSGQNILGAAFRQLRRSDFLPSRLMPPGKKGIRSLIMDFMIYTAVMTGCTLIGLLFRWLGFSDATIITVYILGVLISAVLVTSYLSNIIVSFEAMIVFNFFFTEPLFTLHAYDAEYPVTFVVMLIVSFISSTIAARLKAIALQSDATYARTKLLFDTASQLHKMSEYNEILSTTGGQLAKLGAGETTVRLLRNQSYDGFPGAKTTEPHEGEELVLDCYCSFPTWGKWCSACMGAVEMDEILEKSAAETMCLVNPKVWFLSFDEVRTGGGCRDCLAIGDMAHVYAAFIKKAMATVRRLRPDAEFYVWNDLVDPYALQDDGKNAGMYSSMKGVWDLLPRDLGIGYWTYKWREEGTRFFAERGHPLMLCGYYDEKVLKRSLDWMDLAVRTPNCRGVMYCTWGNHWDLLGEFGDKMLEMDKKAKKE